MCCLYIIYQYLAIPQSPNTSLFASCNEATCLLKPFKAHSKPNSALSSSFLK